MSPPAAATSAPEQSLIDHLVETQGFWQGKRIQSRKGNCASANYKTEATLDVRVTEDGELIAWYGVEGSDEKTPFLVGSIAADGSIAATSTSKVVCDQEAGQIATEWSGAVRETKKGLEMVLEGLEEPCPGMGCRFKVKFKLNGPAPQTGL